MDSHKIFPLIKVLKRQDQSKLYHLNLVYQENENEELPMITFVEDKGDVKTPIRNLDNEEFSGSSLVKNAFANLRSLELEWESIKSGDAQYFQIYDKEYATEKILDKNFLTQTAESIKASTIAVSIPCRDAILCCDAMNPTSVAALEAKSNELFNDYSKDQVANQVFIIEQGNITKQYSLKMTESVKMELFEIPEELDHKLIKMSLFEAIFTVKITIGATDNKIFSEGLYKLIHNALIQFASDKNFNGKIDIQSNMDAPKKTRETIEMVESFFDRITENLSLQKLRKKMTNPLIISFLFGSDFQTGDIHKKYILNFNQK